MLSNIIQSLKNINYKLYLSLLILGLIPTIYVTIRVFFLGQLPDEYSFSIAGQLSWVNLIYEILNEAIILPLFFFFGKIKKDNYEFSNRIRTGLIISFCVYSVLSAFIIIFTKPLLSIMAINQNILDTSICYIRIESIANIFSILTQFILVVLVSVSKSRYLYLITITKLILCLICDTFLVSSLPFALNLGVNGIGFSNIIVNILTLSVSFYFLSKEDVHIFKKTKLNFKWMKNFIKIGVISGFESFIRNIAYIVMISRMINLVNEQGTYWVANNFIWGWLLLPVLQLGELIKHEISTDVNNIKKNTLGYFIITIFISVLWFISIPLWKPFMTYVLGFDDIDKLFNLVLLLVGFYVLFSIQNIFDSTFYGLGKTKYMLFESVATNLVYYGTAYILYLTKFWTPSITSIALLFGIGNAFDSIVSFFAYKYLLKKENINIFKI